MSESISLLYQDNVQQPPASSRLGSEGEALAARFAKSSGYRIVMANFKVPIGRNRRGAPVTGEIDLIAYDGPVICFIEVKTRRSDVFAGPLSAVDRRKQRQIIRAARAYRKIFRIWNTPVRFDVITVLMPENNEPIIELVRGFWSENSFRKRAWTGDIY
jgi:putative endonuclease